MPFVNIKWRAPRFPASQSKQLRQRATGLMEGVMRKRFALTVVAVEQVPEECWSVGSGAARAAAFLESKVARGTDTAEEKARSVTESMQMLRKVVGTDLEPVAYVVVHEVPRTPGLRRSRAGRSRPSCVGGMRQPGG